MIELMMATALAMDCSPPSGTQALLDLSRRYVVVGEAHGSVETPRAFAQMICAAAQSGGVTVALEMPDSMQPQLDAFMAASEDAEAINALRQTDLWDLRFQDGRGSVAMVEMMLTVRRLRLEGRDVVLRAFVSSSRRPSSFDQNYHELAMAQGLARVAMERPEATVMVLVGSFHAGKALLAGDNMVPAIAHLPASEVVTLDVPQQGGRSWSCTVETCGPRDILQTWDPNPRGIILTPTADGLYDGVLAVGPLTASPPAAEIY